MLGFILISQNGRVVKTYGNAVGSSQTSSKMKLSTLCLLVIFSVSSIVAAESEYYPVADIGSDDDYLIEQIANRLREDHELMKPYHQDSVIEPDLGPAFTYRLPPGSEKSEFAVRPSDPLYYHDTRVTPDQRESVVKVQKTSERQSLPPVVDDDTFQPPRPGDVTVDREQTNHEPDYEQRENGAKDAQYARAQVIQTPVHGPDDKTDIYFIAIVAGCSAAAVVGVIVIGVSWYKLQRNAKMAADVEYPAYGVTGPNKDTSPTGDRKLAHSAQMYHYQHQKQQIIAMESQAANERNGSVSEAESDEENEEGDYTVYECPGLAPTGEMEVKNPLFLDDPTPATPAPTNQNKDSKSGDVTNTKK